MNNNSCLTKLVSASRCVWLSISLACMAVSIAGCVEGRSSTHELEHVVPAHWPMNLADAAEKIEARIVVVEAQSSESEQARNELSEIISWLPEVAADTALSEPDWSTINAVCQKNEALLKSSDDLKRVLDELRNLCVKLREFQATLEST